MLPAVFSHFESPEVVRERQLTEGRRLNGTLRVSTGRDQQRRVSDGKKPQFGASPQQAQPKPAPTKFVAKGHDRILDGLMKSGNEMIVVLAQGETLRGKLVARDKYTLTVERMDGARLTVFKHAIDLFYENANRKSKTTSGE